MPSSLDKKLKMNQEKDNFTVFKKFIKLVKFQTLSMPELKRRVSVKPFTVRFYYNTTLNIE